MNTHENCLPGGDATQFSRPCFAFFTILEKKRRTALSLNRSQTKKKKKIPKNSLKLIKISLGELKAGNLFVGL